MEVAGDRRAFLNSLIDKILVKTFLQDVRVQLLEATKKGDNYSGDISRLVVERGDEKINFIIKTPPEDPAHRKAIDVSRTYFREVYCYEKIFPEFDLLQNEYLVNECEKFRHPKCLHTSLEENHEVIVMEDLSQLAFVTLEKQDIFDWETLQLTVKTLANFHALSFAMRVKKPYVYLEIIRQLKSVSYIGDHMMNMLIECLKQSKDLITNENYREKFSKLLPNMREKLMNDFTYTTSEPHNVLVHGDAWIKNLMFKFQENQPIDLIIVDWQLCKITSPVFDLSIVLFSNTDSTTRRQVYHNYYDSYYEQLRTRLNVLNCDIDVCYPRHIYEDHIKFFSSYGLALSIVGCAFIFAKDDLDYSELDKEGADFKHCPKSIKQLNEIIEDAVYFKIL